VAPSLLDCFLEALNKRDGRDPHPQVPISPSPDQSLATAEPKPSAVLVARDGTG